MINCKNCKFYMHGHDGMIISEAWGSCLNTRLKMNVKGLCEGCVNVEDRVEDFELVIKPDFGCKYFISNRTGKPYQK